MNSVPDAVIHAGVLLPDPALHSAWFAVLAAFVATNTLMYAALAVTKILPKLYLTDWTRRRDQRSETRSIHPATDSGGDAPRNQDRATLTRAAMPGTDRTEPMSAARIGRHEEIPHSKVRRRV